MRTKAIHFLLFTVLLFSGVLKTHAETMLYNFEDGTTQLGTWGMAWSGAPYISSYAPNSNPNSSSINTTAKSLNLVENAGVNWWDNFSVFTLTTPTTISSANRYLHIMYRTSNIAGGGYSINLNRGDMNGVPGNTRFDGNLTANNTWQDIVIDLNYLLTNNVQLSSFGMNPDLNGWGGGSGGTYNFDEIILSNNPLPRPYLTVNNLYDFESSTAANMSSIETNSNADNPVTFPFTNPMNNVSNTSANVGKRSVIANGQWWTGFFCTFSKPVQVDDTHKYLHVLVTVPVAGQKVICEVTQNGTNVNPDVERTISYANTWQDVVFDLSSMAYFTGTNIRMGHWDGTAVGDYYCDEIWIDGNSTPRSNATITLTNNNPSMGNILGAGTFTKTTSNTVTATSNSGYHFVNWTESGITVSTNATYTFTISANRVLLANFEPNTVAVSSGTTNVADITCTTCDVIVASGAELNINATQTLKSVTVAPGARLTHSVGTLTATNGITLQSDATGTATLMDSYSTPTVSATVKQYVTAGRNWYMSSPITTAAYSLLNRGNSVVEWNEITKLWDNVTNGNLVSGKGYIQIATAAQGTTGTIDFNGITNSGNVTVSLTRTESGSSRGFNLVGNPYPSYLDWAQVAAANTNVMPTLWLRTKNNSGAYMFATVNVAVPSSPQIVAVDPKTTISSLRPPMHDYWVRMNANPSSTTFTVTNNMRSHRDVSGNTYKVLAQKTTAQPQLRLQISNGINVDETLIYTNPNASNAFDMYDSPKMANGSASFPEIYTLAGSEQLVISGLNTIPYYTELPIGFTTGTAGTFSIKASELKNFDAGIQLILKDYLDINNPVTTDLSDGSSYSFTSDATINNSSRFTLTFKAPSTTTGINPESNGNVWISTRNGDIVVNGATNRVMLEVFNTVGQKVISRNLTGTNIQLYNSLATGTYLVKLTTEGKSITRKIIID